MLIRGCFAGVLVAVVVGGAVGADDWPNWRGPNHDGISAEKGLVTEWTDAPPVVWKAEIGSAFSGITCVAGKVYTCGTANDKQVLYCLDAVSGKVIWQTPFEKKYEDGQGGDGTRATPAVSDGLVYVHGALGRLVCFNVSDGREVWSRDFNAKPRWGYSGSVLIEGDLAIVAVGGDDGALVALDKKTGTPKWKCGRGVAGYATPYPFTFEGRRYVAAFLGEAAMIVDVEDEREVWRQLWKTDYDVNAATPIYHDGHLFLSSGYKHGSILLKLRPAPKKLAASEVWQSDSVRAKFQTPVLYEGHLYTSDEQGLKCVEFMTGKEKWSQRGRKHGTVVIADGHLFVLTEHGKLEIAKATPDGLTPLSNVRVGEGRHWTVPTLYDGRLYVRDLKGVTCFGLSGK